MKKQILSKVNEKKSSTTTEQVDWKRLKLILELMLACLVKRNTDGEHWKNKLRTEKKEKTNEEKIG